MFKRIRLAGALAFIVAAAPLTQIQAQDKTKQDKTKHDQHHERSMSKMSDQFMPHVLEMNAAEVEIGRLAMTKSQNPRVKEYAGMIVKDHNNTLESLGGLWHRGMREQMTSNTRKGGAVGATREKPTDDTARSRFYNELSTKHQKTYDRLSKLSGREFDREYINAMIGSHKEAIEFYENHTNAQQASGTSEEDRVHTAFSDLSRELLPRIRQHLQQAQTIQRDLQTTTNKQNR